MKNWHITNSHEDQTLEDIEEERRLAYVAVTRAAKGLHCSRPTAMSLKSGKVKKLDGSRFIDEMKNARPGGA